MTKKLLAVILSLVMVLAFAACGKEESKDTNTSDSTEVTQDVVDNNTDDTTQDEVVEVGDDNTTEEQPSASGSDTVAQTLLGEFMATIETTEDLEAVANTLSSSETLSVLGMMVMPVEEGWLNGFDEEIAGFTQGYTFSPMIGSIPFVGYVFETEDAAALVETLKAHGQLNWNICTTADEMVVEASGNYVFFVMAPFSLDE